MGVCAGCKKQQPLYGKNWVVEHVNETTQERCLGSKKAAMQPVFDPTPEMKAREEKKKASKIASGRIARSAARKPTRVKIATAKRKGTPPTAWEVRG